jgi:hypothetical protein
MLIAPFFFISAYILLQPVLLCKPVALLPLDALDGALYLAQHHFGYVAGCAAELHNRIERIEIIYIPE